MRRNSTDFVADYAAKRAAQLEHAKQLRDHRVGKSAAAAPLGAAPVRNENDSAFPPRTPPSETLTPLQHPVGASPRGMAASNAPLARLAALPQPARREVLVTEQDFRRATQLGIITVDQARQLWAVLSAQATTLTPEATQTPTTMSSYNPAIYTPNAAPLGVPSSKTALQRLAEDDLNSRAAARVDDRNVVRKSNGRPQWNADSAVEYSEPPPVIQREVPQPQQREKPQVVEVSKPADRRSAASSTRSVASRNTKAAEPVEVEPPKQSPAEIAEFQRLLGEQKRKFEEALEEAETGEPLVECRLCERHFRESIIDRHEVACKKANKKRKVFDMKGQRLEGIEGAEELLMLQKKAAASSKRPSAASTAATGTDKPVNKLPKWKLQHQQFQAALAAIRQANGDPTSSAPPLPMPESLDDRVPCPHCGRKFAQNTAERHIPKCTSISAKPKMLMRPPRR